MKVLYHNDFEKSLKKRILSNFQLYQKFKSRLSLKLSEPSNPILKDHKLGGKKSSFRAFSVTGDIRVIYKLEGEIITLYDVGTHNQVYK
jgi:addiction module RelE/StbE family toxin